jgi:hypothetical protein
LIWPRTDRPPLAPAWVKRTGRLLILASVANATHLPGEAGKAGKGLFLKDQPRFDVRMNPMAVDRRSPNVGRRSLDARGTSEFQAIWTPFLLLKT